jgi:hypothetical protein
MTFFGVFLARFLPFSSGPFGTILTNPRNSDQRRGGVRVKSRSNCAPSGDPGKKAFPDSSPER